MSHEGGPMASQMQPGPPYIPQTASPGLRPNVRQDVAPCAVFTAIYLASAICHQTIFQLNRKRGHFFPISWAMFGFSMARVGTMMLRLGWAIAPNNARLAMAAIIFVNIGVLVIYVVVLVLCLRMFRALQPRLGWNPMLDKGIKATYAALFVCIVLVIAFVIVSFYTRDMKLLKAALWIQRAAILYFMAFNLIGPLLYLLAILLPRDPLAEDFGTGSTRSKLVILGIAIFFNLFIAGFRTGTAWAGAHPLSDPPWYDLRATFYIVELGFEIIITYLFLFTRLDKRFWVPNKSSKPGDYSSQYSPLDPRSKQDGSVGSVEQVEPIQLGDNSHKMDSPSE